MTTLSCAEVLKKIQNNETFSVVLIDNSITVTVEEYVPFICTAIHAGGNLRHDLRSNMLLSKYERWYDEHPFTGQFISSLPIHIIAHDSRFEYDLNRSPESSIIESIEQKQIWKETLSQSQKEQSQSKHQEFYTIITALVQKIERQFGGCLIYDIHAYNFKKRSENDLPLFTVNTLQITQQRYEITISHWLKELAKIRITNIQNRVEQNSISAKTGYLINYITSKFSNTLILPTYLKKIYCDESSGDEYPEIIGQLREGMKNSIIANAAFFIQNFTTLKVKKKYKILSSKIDNVLTAIDAELHSYVKSFDLLHYVNPLNIDSEKKKFFSSKFRYSPDFKYKLLKVDPSEIKQKLYQIPIQKIRDVHLQKLYKETIEAEAETIDMIALRKDKRFLYLSLKHFGEPDEKDITNANFLLHSNEFHQNGINEQKLSAEQVAELLQTELDLYQIQCKIELSTSISAQAAFFPGRRVIRINKKGKFSSSFASALGHHEIGVHLLTTINAGIQPLNIFKIGFPNHTETQEGLAILSEYLSGTLTLARLKTLALRVVGVSHMIRNQSFKETFSLFVEEYHIDPDEAFDINVRIYRGGGLTKDYVYLRGFKDVFDYHQKHKSVSHLLVGKTSLAYLHLLDELITRNIVKEPAYIARSFKSQNILDPILTYIVKCLK